ncbi:type I DNA topoisomerase [Patescibacteria group bacterium]|nr:MAG: type I DNA topoisomerase [Patescibacteria group bacterium]
MSTLVIVESPTKAKTISKFLGKDYTVKSSFGHLRDLPKSKLGVDTEHNFEPHYIVSRAKTKIAKELKSAAKKCDEVLFATDEDREGEAISWHLAFILDIDPEDAKRIVFHEITKTAITHALQNPRPLDMKMVHAQQARRVLDRLVGYELSPFLWRKVARGLSAGRVQSVAVRLICEREREIQAFKSEEYWTLEGTFIAPEKAGEPKEFSAKLFSMPGKKLEKLDLKNKEQIDKILSDLKDARYAVAGVEEKKIKRVPPPPFTTSALQQEAHHRLGFSAKQTMMLAQQLYEGVELTGEGAAGLITYMRTDSVNLSEKFLDDAKNYVQKTFGSQYALTAPRVFRNKSKNAQEAHESIRPTEAGRAPDQLKDHLEKNQFRLYDLIWRRALATQMAAAELKATAIDIACDKNYDFKANGQQIIFDGFLQLYPDKSKENYLPRLKKDDEVSCKELKPEQHFTEPPARYNDATLVKTLEDYGIGRPSTYAPTIATIEDRGYIERDDKKRLAPKEIAFLVNDLLVKHFPHVVDFKFTAEIEDSLDQIARGQKQWQPVVADFYGPFEKNLRQKDQELKKSDIAQEKTDEVCEKCGSPMLIKMGRFGKFMACSNFPECKNTKNLNGGKSAEPEPTDEICEKCGSPMLKRQGRYGPFLGCSKYPACKNIKNIDVKINLKCPKCGAGDVVAKRSKRGKTFYGCNRYPDCDFALWDKPTGELCPDCGKPLVFGKEKTRCSNKECSYEKNPA